MGPSRIDLPSDQQVVALILIVRHLAGPNEAGCRNSIGVAFLPQKIAPRHQALEQSILTNSFQKKEIDERYIDSPYYIAPDGSVGEEAFAVIRDTIANLKMVALGRVVLARREHVIALEPKGRGLVGITLRYPYEVRDEKPYFEDIPELKLSKEMLDLAAHIVHTKSGHFDPSQFEDRYENALIDLLKKKQAGEKIEPAREAPPPRVVNLMDALRASIDAEQKKAPAPSTRARRPAKKATR